MKNLLAVVVAAVCVTTFVAQADWNHTDDGSFALAAGYHPTPPSTPMDDSFRNTTTEDGRRRVQFSVTVCCMKVDVCPPNMDRGVWWHVDIVIYGPGWQTTASTSTHCCTPCCTAAVSVTEGTAGQWGGTPTGVDLTIDASCICCLFGNWNLTTTTEVEDYVYPSLEPIE